MLKSFKYTLLLSSILCFAACTEKIVIEEVDVIVEEPVAPLTTYNYDGKDYSVHTLQYTTWSEDTYYGVKSFTEFVVAREYEEPFGNVIYFYICNDNLNKTLDVTDLKLTYRYDYLIIFEDAMHFYPSYYTPKKGTLSVRKGTVPDEYEIDINIEWSDGKPLIFRYKGKFEKHE